jgi:hypothetical protein
MKRTIILAFMLTCFIIQALPKWHQKDFIITFWNPPTRWELGQVKRDEFNLYNAYPIDANSNPYAENGEIWLLQRAEKLGIKILLTTDCGNPKTSDCVSNVINQQDKDYWNSIIKQPAYAGFFLCDEPNVKELDGWKTSFELYKTKDTNPDHFAWINLFPVYATRKTLGYKSGSQPIIDVYKDYINRFSDKLALDFLSFDFYRFDKRAGRDQDYFINLELIRTKAKEKQLPFISILQGTQFQRDWKRPTYNELSWQAYTSMTYGSTGIVWFVYDKVDTLGDNDAGDTLGCYRTRYPRFKGDTYIHKRMPIANSVAKINQYIKTLGRELINLESTHVYHTGALQKSTTPVPTTCPINVTGGNFVVGLFKNKSGEENCFMVTNKDFLKSQVVTLKSNKGKINLKGYRIKVEDNPNPEKVDWVVHSDWINLKQNSNGSYTLKLASGSGMLFKISY